MAKLEKQAERKKKSTEKKLLGEIEKHQKINKIDLNKNKTKRLKRTATETQTIQSARKVETSAKEKKIKNPNTLKTNKNINAKKKITVSFSSKNKKKKRGAEDKTQANDRDADGNPYTCIFCQEVYIFPPSEPWIQCDQCKLWCHGECSAGATDNGYTCDLCSQ